MTFEVTLPIPELDPVGSRKKRKYLTKWIKFLSTDGMKQTIRATITFGIAILFTLIRPLQEAFGPLNSLVTIAIILIYADTSTSLTSIGGVIQTLVRFSVATAVASGYTLAVLKLAYALESHGLVIVVCMFLGVFLCSYIRALYPKEWTIPMLMAKVVVVIALLVASRDMDQMNQIVLEVFVALLVGTGISMVCMFVLFPHSACWALKREMAITLNQLADLLELSTKGFLMGTNSEDLLRISQLRTSTNQKFAKLTSYLNDTKVELHYGLLRTQDYIIFTRMTKVLLQHAWSMASCNPARNSLDNSEMVDKLLHPLQEPVAKLAKLSADDIRQFSRLIESSEEFNPSLYKELGDSLKKFDEEHNKLIKKIVHQEFEELYIIYFWIFSFREFITSLDSLMTVAKTLGRQKRLHFPVKLWALSSSKLRIHNLSPYSKRYTIWRALMSLNSFEATFALKTAIAVALTAMFQFFPGSEHIFTDWRGEWGVVTIPITIAPTFGGNYVNGFYRVAGTFAGAIWAAITWIIFPNEPYGLWCFLMLWAGPCFYVLQNTKYPKMGLITLVNTTVILLGGYNNYHFQLSDDEIYELAYKRAISVTLGVVIVVFVSRYVWPYLARKELRKDLSVTVNQIGVHFCKLISTLMKDMMENDIVTEFEKAEAKLQLKVAKDLELLALAASEPRLKGKFPSSSYATIIQSCQFIIDRMRSMRLSIKGFGKKFRQEIIKPLNVYRKDMIADVLMLFYICAGALHSKAPLPHYLPRARKSREIVLHELKKLQVLRSTNFYSTTEYVPFYAYGRAILELIDQLDIISATLKQMFGEVDFISSMFENEVASQEDSGATIEDAFELQTNSHTE